MPWVNLFVVPAFALANAGVRLHGDALEGRAATLLIVGLVSARVLGKLVGVTGGSLLATRLGLGRLPDGVGLRILAGAALAAGAPFTVSLFVASTTFAAETGLLAAADVGVLLSVLACAIAAAIVLRSRSTGDATGTR